MSEEQKFFTIEGIIVGYLMPEMDDPKWDFIECHGEILVVRTNPGRIYLRSIINDVYMTDGENEDPELNFKIGQRVTFSTNIVEQRSYGYA
jgi:hypothetical protein